MHAKYIATNHGAFKKFKDRQGFSKTKFVFLTYVSERDSSRHSNAYLLIIRPKYVNNSLRRALFRVTCEATKMACTYHKYSRVNAAQIRTSSERRFGRQVLEMFARVLSASFRRPGAVYISWAENLVYSLKTKYRQNNAIYDITKHILYEV